jgi:4-amino-4-deoxychorismate lyase
MTTFLRTFSFFLVGTGKVGELTMALSDLLWDDMVAGPATLRIPVPYEE